MTLLRVPLLSLLISLSTSPLLSSSAPPPVRLHEADGDLSILGSWASDPAKLEELRQQFMKGDPYPHVEISDFFAETIASQIESHFPRPQGNTTHQWEKEGWHVYDNPIEGKLANDDVAGMSEHHAVFEVLWSTLQSDKLVQLMQQITEIADLQNDPHLHGAGLHYHPRGSRLEMHLDYSIHPITRKERRVNLIIYMNKDWEEQWGGHLNLWEGTVEGMTKFSKKVAPKYNRAVLFRTSDISWHGMPEPLNCPPDQARKSVAIYYVSDARPDATHRYKASYRPRPGELEPEMEEAYLQLCKLREVRRLKAEDLQEHTPGWQNRWPKI